MRADEKGRGGEVPRARELASVSGEQGRRGGREGAATARGVDAPRATSWEEPAPPGGTGRSLRRVERQEERGGGALPNLRRGLLSCVGSVPPTPALPLQGHGKEDTEGEGE